jgi:hypothetical protein
VASAAYKKIVCARLAQMRHILIILFLLPGLTSCWTQAETHRESISFSTRHLNLPVDTTIRSIAYQKENLLLLQDNGTFVVLDNNYRRVKDIEQKLSFLNAIFLNRYHDTIFVGSKDKFYYLDNEFSPIGYKVVQRTYGEVFLEDSAYLIYGCCAGEWGGSIFFQSKKTGKTYSYFATCPTQVLCFGKDYVVCNNLAHLSESMSFLVVKDPTTLYEIKDEKLKNHCNWYTEIDSLKGYWEVSKVGAVRFYDAYRAMSLITFPFKDSLFSILSTAKTTTIAIHRGDTTVTIDTLLKRKIFFHETQVIEAGNRKICLYKLTGGSPVAAYSILGNNTGLVIVDGNKIDFLEK